MRLSRAEFLIVVRGDIKFEKFRFTEKRNRNFSFYLCYGKKEL